MKNKLLFTILFFFASQLSFATTWKTISVGYWNNGSVWQGGIAPPNICGDTILIQHPIVVENNITLSAGALLIIDNYGGICGHHKMRVESNATFIKYGLFEMDSLKIPGGDVIFNQPGNWKLVYNINISNMGSFVVNGAGGGVGPWFNCQMPEYSFLTGVPDDADNYFVNAFPNPSSGNINFTNNFISKDLKLKLTSASGAVIFDKDISGESTIKIEGLSSGIYFYFVQFGEAITKPRKIIVIR